MRNVSSISAIWFFFAKWVADSDHPWGKLPFAKGQVRGITATYEKSIGVIIDGVHPDFIEATRLAQGKPSNERSAPSSDLDPSDPLLGPTGAR